ncbi:MAG: RadC family protein [Candidatus Woesearchaeota archaeon]
MFIHEIGLAERPREKLVLQGIKALSLSELLALVLRTGSKSENVVDLSRRIIKKFGAEKLSSCSLQELQSVNGVGIAKACQIVALFEFVNRVKFPVVKSIKSPDDVFSYFKPFISGLLKEHFFILMLNTKNKILKHEVVSVGTLDSSLVHPREVFRPALKEGCFSVILVHNHPSGDPSPSDDDLVVTERLIEAGKLLGVSVLDHVILGRDSFWSYKHDS